MAPRPNDGPEAQAAAADRALQDYKHSQQSGEYRQRLADFRAIVNLSTQSANARIAVAEAKAALMDGINDPGDAKNAYGSDAPSSTKLNVALNNTDLVKLRSELRDVTAKAAELEATFGRNHAVVAGEDSQENG